MGGSIALTPESPLPPRNLHARGHMYWPVAPPVASALNTTTDTTSAMLTTTAVLADLTAIARPSQNKAVTLVQGASNRTRRLALASKIPTQKRHLLTCHRVQPQCQFDVVGHGYPFTRGGPDG